MIPQTIFEIEDQTKTETVFKENKTPLFMMGFSTDKGPEDFRIVRGKNFYKLYGKNISFKKHGQPLIQAANIIDNGGTLLCKRVVAEDSTLSNIAIIAKIKEESILKTTDDGKPLYIDSITGKETEIVGTNKRATSSKCKIKYELETVTNSKSIQEIKNIIGNKLNNEGNEGEYAYPLFILTDIGRGKSNKKIRINPDYESSRYLNTVIYNLNIIENDNITETIQFSVDPDMIIRGLNIFIEPVVNFNSKQIRCKGFEDSIKLFIKKISECSGNELNFLKNNDILFGVDKDTNNLPNIEIIKDKDNPINLSYTYGINLENGTNGNFEDCPFNTDEYNKQMARIFNGEFDQNIYDYDLFNADIIVDANYDESIKKEIENFVAFREDIFYFRDMGINMRSLDSIIQKSKSMMHNIFCATYGIFYDIIDPYSKKQIPVTIGYSLSRLLIKHFKDGRSRPLAGQRYDMIIPEAIEGTVNIIPKITPSINEKRQLCDNKINYASYYDRILTLETLYTSQEINSQFSFINNILAIQEIIKEVRKKCPKIRYSFIHGKDLETYKTNVQDILDLHSSNFKELKMVYVKDETMEANKVYYAAIYVSFKDFVQTEYFKLYAIK